MALGALAENPDCGLSVIPCGMNYFHAHKFRSRAVVEFGTPVSIPPELVEKYKNGERRESVSKVLELIYDALVSVTVQSPDYDTLMVSLLARTLSISILTLPSSSKPSVVSTIPKARNCPCPLSSS